MAAYIVAQLDMKNTNWQKEYAGSLMFRESLRGPTPRAPHSVVTAGAWQRPVPPAAAPAHD